VAAAAYDAVAYNKVIYEEKKKATVQTYPQVFPERREKTRSKGNWDLLHLQNNKHLYHHRYHLISISLTMVGGEAKKSWKEKKKKKMARDKKKKKRCHRMLHLNSLLSI